MIAASIFALLKEKENNNYIMTRQGSTQIYYINNKIKEIDNKLEEARSIQNNYKENNQDKINELELWQKQVEKIKSYLS